jgi:hypothetical protein
VARRRILHQQLARALRGGLLEHSPDVARRAAVKFRLAGFLAWGAGELVAAERMCHEVH